MAEQAVPYDDGDGASSVAGHPTAAGRSAPMGTTAWLSSDLAVPVTLAAGLPVQPGTSTIWTVSDGGGSLTVDGTVAVSGSVAVTGTFWQATQPVSIAATVAVSGPLTDAQLRASAVPVSLTSTTITGTVAATQSGTWTVTGAGGTFPVTDSGGSLTVDAPVGTPVFVRLSDGTNPITQLPVRMLAIDDDADTMGLVAGSIYTAGINDAIILWSNLRDASGAAIASATTGPGASDRGLVVRPIEARRLKAGTTQTLQNANGSAISNGDWGTVGTDLDNRTELARSYDFELDCGFDGGGVSAGEDLDLYLVPKLDGTNAADIDTANDRAQADHYAGTFLTASTGTASRRLTVSGVDVGPHLYAVRIFNQSGVQVSANWSLKAYPVLHQSGA